MKAENTRGLRHIRKVDMLVIVVKTARGEQMKTILCCVLLTAAACAAESPPEDTHGLANGRYWMEVPSSHRLMYISGVVDALIVTRPPQGNDLLAPGFNGGEVMRCIDQFFGESANIRVPIVHAMMVCAKKFKGASPSEIEAMTIDFRRRAFGSGK